MKRKRITDYKKLLISLLIFLVSFSFSYSQGGIDANSYKFIQVLKLVSNYYVDSTNEGGMIEDAINGMLKQLDPHSVYIPKKDLQLMNENLQGNFEGIGVQFNILHDTLVVIAPLSGGPSEKLGILAGDRILKIDGENIAGVGLTNEGVYKRLKGKKGTMVTVSIKRQGMNELIDFEIIRDKIPIFSRDAAYMVTDKIGYVKLNRFANSTGKEFEEALVKLKNEGMEDLILDLKGNGGGFLHMAVSVANQFFDNNKMMVYTKGDNSRQQNYKSNTNGLLKNGKIIILIDQGSASASEIVAGAVQDWDRGVILGRRSFGKGLVQAQYNLMDGSAVRLTTARYYTPTGRLIQKSYTNGTDEYRMEILYRIGRGELSNADSIQFPDSLKFKTLINKRTVYGGGGIMPDLFVPVDTTFFSDYYVDLIRFGIINRFIYDYVDKNRDEIKNKYSDFDQFNKKFQIDKKFMTVFLKFADDEELKRTAEKEVDMKKKTEGLKASEELLKLQLKALIARDIYDTSEYFEVINPINPDFILAIEILGNDALYQKHLNN
ncbi:S41 family peptidase [Bacteroidota bacterium]